MGYLNRICHTCGKPYRYCYGCPEENTRDLYKIMWDSKKCQDIWDVCSRYATNEIDEKEAKKLLDGLIEEGVQYTESVQKQLDKIYAAVTENTQKINADSSKVKSSIVNDNFKKQSKK